MLSEPWGERVNSSIQPHQPRICGRRGDTTQSYVGGYEHSFIHSLTHATNIIELLPWASSHCPRLRDEVIIKTDKNPFPCEAHLLASSRVNSHGAKVVRY